MSVATIPMFATAAGRPLTSADLPDIPILETAQLRLRAFSDDDLDEYASICANPDFMRFLSAGRPLSREEAYDQLLFIWAHWRAHSYGLWAVEEKCCGQLILDSE